MGLAVAVVAAVVAGGCSAPEAPRFVGSPDATVDRVERVAVTEQAAEYQIYVTVENPNEVALPLPLATYTLTVDGRSYRTDTVPDTTLPRERPITVVLPAVIEDGATLEEGAAFEVRGWLTYHPPGQVKQFFYDLGWPMPQVMFFGQGQVGAAE